MNRLCEGLYFYRDELDGLGVDVYLQTRGGYKKCKGNIVQSNSNIFSYIPNIAYDLKFCPKFLDSVEGGAIIKKNDHIIAQFYDAYFTPNGNDVTFPHCIVLVQ